MDRFLMVSSESRNFFALPQEEKDKIGLAHQDGARGAFLDCIVRFGFG